MMKNVRESLEGHFGIVTLLGIPFKKFGVEFDTSFCRPKNILQKEKNHLAHIKYESVWKTIHVISMWCRSYMRLPILTVRCSWSICSHLYWKRCFWTFRIRKQRYFTSAWSEKSASSYRTETCRPLIYLTKVYIHMCGSRDDLPLWSSADAKRYWPT